MFKSKGESQHNVIAQIFTKDAGYWYPEGVDIFWLILSTQRLWKIFYRMLYIKISQLDHQYKNVVVYEPRTFNRFAPFRTPH